MPSTPIDRTECRCRACGAEGLTTLLSLGETPFADRLLTEAQLADVEVYRKTRQCGPDDRGNLDDVLEADTWARTAARTLIEAC